MLEKYQDQTGKLYQGKINKTAIKKKLAAYQRAVKASCKHPMHKGCWGSSYRRKGLRPHVEAIRVMERTKHINSTLEAYLA